MIKPETSRQLNEMMTIDKKLDGIRALVSDSSSAFQLRNPVLNKIEKKTEIKISSDSELPNKLRRILNNNSFSIELDSDNPNATHISKKSSDAKELTKLIKDAILSKETKSPKFIYITLECDQFTLVWSIIDYNQFQLNIDGFKIEKNLFRKNCYIASKGELCAYIFYFPYKNTYISTLRKLDSYRINFFLGYILNKSDLELFVPPKNSHLKDSLISAVAYKELLINFLSGRGEFPSEFTPLNFFDVSSISLPTEPVDEHDYEKHQAIKLRLLYEIHKNLAAIINIHPSITPPSNTEISLHQQLIRGLRHISSDKHLYLKGNQDVTIRNENDITSSLNSFINDSSDNFHSAVEVNRNAGRVDLMLSSSKKETVFLCECKIIGKKKHASNSGKIKLLKNDKDAIRKSITQIKQYLHNSKKNIGYIIIYSIDLSPEETITSMSQLISEMNKNNEALSISLISTPLEFSESIPCYKLDNKDNYNIRIVVCQFDTKSPTENFK